MWDVQMEEANTLNLFPSFLLLEFGHGGEISDHTDESNYLGMTKQQWRRGLDP